MSDDNGNFSPLQSLRRYVPLICWAMVILVLLIIPLKIIEYGYLPGDDSERHAAKAVSGKSWQEILVLNPVYKIDHEYGWNLLLEKIYQWTHWDTDKLVVFSVVFLFLLVNWPMLPWLKRPEAWLIVLVLAMLTSDIANRFTLGRPYLVTLAGLMTILFLWQRHGALPPKLWMNVLMTVVVVLSTYVHGTWYLWVLLIGAFFVAGQFRWSFTFAACWVVGVLLGASLTGHPIAYPVQAIKLALLAVGMHETVRTMASELQPDNGSVFGLLLLGGLIVFRQFTKINPVPLTKSPVFWMAAFGWVLSFKVGRFAEDWGWPALLVLVAWDLELFLRARFEFDSFKRLGFTGCVVVAAFLSLTADINSRWSSTLVKRYLIATDPDLRGWMPDKGGILYTASMTTFYDTFFKNPHGDWKYMLGFEPTWMPKKDFEVYHNILWNFGDAKAYTPWVKQMNPADRLVIAGGRGSSPEIPQLEWEYGVSGYWIGRTPRTNTPPDEPRPTAPATASMDSLTNAVPEGDFHL
ncbi:MAG TPA: hypothetical protein VFV23_03600 [Verrucomicrobiae bacterium]|nr:hypothetical protein [Verrucomicrobiae bacterium]